MVTNVTKKEIEYLDVCAKGHLDPFRQYPPKWYLHGIVEPTAGATGAGVVTVAVGEGGLPAPVTTD